MYRGDALACDVVCRAAHETGVLSRVYPVHTLFPCLALSHQEDPAMQAMCLQLWERVAGQFAADDPIWTFATSFKTNHEVIARFGRFPQRNALFGRTSTPEEKHFLEQSEQPPPVKPRASNGGFRGPFALALSHTLPTLCMYVYVRVCV
jgi:uncharacterized protein (DUF924 family)